MDERKALAQRSELIGILLMGMALLLLVGIKIEHTGLIAVAGSWLNRYIGGGVYVLSLAAWLTGIDMFRGKTINRPELLASAWLLLMIAVMAIWEDLFSAGGYVGAAVSDSMGYIFGPAAGKYIAEAILLLISAALVLDMLFSTFLLTLRRYFVRVFRGSWLAFKGLSGDFMAALRRFGRSISSCFMKSAKPGAFNGVSEGVSSAEKPVVIYSDNAGRRPGNAALDEQDDVRETGTAGAAKAESAEIGEAVAHIKTEDLNIAKAEDVEIEEAASNTDISEGAAEISEIEYEHPELDLLDQPTEVERESEESLIQRGQKIVDKLESFRLNTSISGICQGPSITRYELQLASGIKVSQIAKLNNDIGMALATTNIRIEAPIPGKSAVGIEVPNVEPAPVYFREVVESPLFLEDKSLLAIALGKNIAGEVVVADLKAMPHLLIAGATGSGKSVCVNSIISSILLRARPDMVKFLMIDPKMVEMSVYKEIPHLLLPPVIDSRQASVALAWAVEEMERRYRLLADNDCRGIESYNETVKTLRQEEGGTTLEYLPYIVIVIDELGDLMNVAKNEVEEAIQRIAQKARAIGMHLVVATQRPSVNVITGVIKANLPSRISFSVTSQTDSRTILDMKGAESLIGRGDMLYAPVGSDKPIRVQGAYLSTREVVRIVQHLKEQCTPDYDHNILKAKTEARSGGVRGGDPKRYFEDEELLVEAVQMVVDEDIATVSRLQRVLGVGQPRAARMIDMMEELGIVGKRDSTKPREVLVKPEQLEEYLPRF